MNTASLEASWRGHLQNEFKKPYMQDLKLFLDREKKNGKIIYPNKKEIFQALSATPFDQVKVVIIGQDPYHGAGQAHGMSFSVKPGVKVPPSLKNIYKEIQSDLDIPISNHGYLHSWADQGVLLLNTVLTVEHSKAGSHRKKGWEEFTDKIIEVLNEKKDHLVFLLWGAPAQKKAHKVDPSRHFILSSAHPSPLSAYRGFFGNKHFSKCNDYLSSQGMTPIDWQVEVYS